MSHEHLASGNKNEQWTMYENMEYCDEMKKCSTVKQI